MKKIMTSIENVTDTRLLEGMYLDIETTGLSKERSILTMLGCLVTEAEHVTVIQWFNDDAVSEEAILKDFCHFLLQYQQETDSPVLITFHGEQFDLPYLLTHFSYHDLPQTIFDSFQKIDLYKKLLPFQNAFCLEHGRQKDWEHLLEIGREDLYTGKEMIKLYKDYLKTKKEELAEKIFLHNKEDLIGLWKLSALYVFPKILSSDWNVLQLLPHSSNALKVICEIPECVPASFHITHEAFSAQCFDNQMIIILPYVDGTMKHFYPDYQNYYYLPEEDYAVHKSIGCYVEPSHRQKAKANCCYVKKEGFFFLLPDSRRKHGLQISKDTYQSLTQYRLDYEQKERYAELDDLMQTNQGLVTYLKDVVKSLLLKQN